MATGGLVAPDGNSTFAMWVTAWYSLVVVPLFWIVLGGFGQIFSSLIFGDEKFCEM